MNAMKELVFCERGIVQYCQHLFFSLPPTPAPSTPAPSTQASPAVVQQKTKTKDTLTSCVQASGGMRGNVNSKWVKGTEAVDDVDVWELDQPAWKMNHVKTSKKVVHTSWQGLSLSSRRHGDD